MNRLLLLTRPLADASHVTLIGPLDQTTCEEFHDRVRSLLTIDANPRPVTINLSCCTYVDDDGLRTLDALRRLAEQRGTAAGLEQVPPLIDHAIRTRGPALSKPARCDH